MRGWWAATAISSSGPIFERFHVANERIFTFGCGAGIAGRTAPRHRRGLPLRLGGRRPEPRDLARGCWRKCVNGQPPRFEIIDELTVRYSWDDPNPGFLSQLASPGRRSCCCPRPICAQVPRQLSDARNAGPDHQGTARRRPGIADPEDGRQNRPGKPRPAQRLRHGCNTAPPPAEQFIFERNPYFHRVDHLGQQLPYIDRLELNVSSADLIPAKTGAGDPDLQFTGLDFVDYTYLKQAEKRFPIRLDLWKRIQGSRMALVPNLNCADPGWRAAMRDLRLRRALSLAVDRNEINMVVFFGLPGAEGEHHPARKPALPAGAGLALGRHTTPDQANALLDEAVFAARGAACAACPTAAPCRSSSRPPAKARCKPTCWN